MSIFKIARRKKPVYKLLGETYGGVWTYQKTGMGSTWTCDDGRVVSERMYCNEWGDFRHSGKWMYYPDRRTPMEVYI